MEDEFAKMQRNLFSKLTEQRESGGELGPGSKQETLKTLESLRSQIELLKQVVEKQQQEKMMFSIKYKQIFSVL